MARAIFVFGSNRAGRHGRGAAREAYLHHGAVYGQGEGRQGESYAIPTKDENLHTLSLAKISVNVLRFLLYVENNGKELEFHVTRIGCGLAGYSDKDIEPMFKGAPENVVLPIGWQR